MARFLAVIVLFVALCQPVGADEPVHIHVPDETLNPPAGERVARRPLPAGQHASCAIVRVLPEGRIARHKHVSHDEIIYVTRGKGRLQLGFQSIQVAPGDYIFVPAGTWHAFDNQSQSEVEVLSIFAPAFDGKDRVFSE